jgi:tRNA(His) 5'-end guanylyltransferase
MTDKTTLGDRMKEYEATTRTSLLRRTPVIIRIDGRAFHTFTKRIVADQFLDTDRTGNRVCDMSLIDTPYSVKLHEVMNATAASLLNNIQNAVFVYTQSDEISVLLKDWDRNETQQWFGAGLQKMCSLSASIATATFNYCFEREFGYVPTSTQDLATFDSRVFNIPKEEVTNYFIWRQQDASRNSVQMYGRHFFSAKEMHGKSNVQVQDMLMLQKGKNWNDLPAWMKRGSAVYINPSWNEWQSFKKAMVDDNIPIFTQDREFVERHLKAEEIDDDVRI